ncbi:MAG: hypothetical protein JXQ83_05110 [Candidatus Glassbacteria bacterium]|nr:hypothetical protein [Candidatus Glassbacteria bacterium]
MRVLPYFQSVVPRRSVAPGRVKPGFDIAERQATPGPSAEAQPAQDRFVPTSLATGIVHSIRHDPQPGNLIKTGLQGDPGLSSSVVKSGMYRLYRLDGNLEKKAPSARGENLDLRG